MVQAAGPGCAYFYSKTHFPVRLGSKLERFSFNYFSKKSFTVKDVSAFAKKKQKQFKTEKVEPNLLFFYLSCLFLNHLD